MRGQLLLGARLRIQLYRRYRSRLPMAVVIVLLVALGIELWAGATVATFFSGGLVFDRLTRKVAKTNASVLLLGETGSGKEMIATAIHRLSLRASGPFVRSSYHADQHVPQPRAGVGPLAARA